jgi:hypothetical protein
LKGKTSSPQSSKTSFDGTIESISGNQLTVDVKLPDTSKPKKSDGSFEVMEKKMTVNTNEKTAFEIRNLAELKAGDMILVTSSTSPLTADTLTADRVMYNKPLVK